MRMNSYKYYQAEHKMSGNKEKKQDNSSKYDTNLLFII